MTTRFWGTGLLVIVLLLVAACDNSGEAPAALVGYRVSTDGRQLTILVDTGGLDTVVRTKATEEPDSVIVEVIMRRYENLQPAMAVRHEVTITLDEPLAARVVRAPTGRALELIAG